jgi:hypothetical protein
MSNFSIEKTPTGWRAFITGIKTDAQKMMEEYYRKFFDSITDNVLYKVYNVEHDNFIKFAGTEGTYHMNANTVIRGFASGVLVADLIVVRMDEDDNPDFENPVIIGSKDQFKTA